MKKYLLISIVFILGLSGVALAAQIEGTIQGFNCITNGKTCPIGKEDPLIATERVFILFTAEGNHYFVPNLDRAILARHIAQRVRITGDLDDKYKAIKAQSFEVMDKDEWKVTWSKEMERDANMASGISGF